MRQSRIRHLRLQNLFEVFFLFSVFPSSTSTFSGSEVGFFFLINIFSLLLLRSFWQSFKSSEAKISKIILWVLFVVFKLCFSTKIVVVDGRRFPFKIFSSILHFIAASCGYNSPKHDLLLYLSRLGNLIRMSWV